MKKIVLTAAVILFTVNSFAINPNLSIDFVRMPSRYATVNSPDAVLYNPAGLTKLENGLYVDISNQFVYKKYGFKPDLSEYVYNDPSTGFSYFFPSANISFKHKNWGVYFTFTTPDGGGNLIYEYGLTANKLKIEASSGWMDFTLGGTYALSDVFSVSLGVRMLMANQTAKSSIGSTVLTENAYKGMGFSGQLGINITPIERMNIGILYRSEAIWAKNDKTTISTGILKPTFYAPNTLSIGIGYDIIDDLNVQLGYKVNFEALAPDFYPNTAYANSMDFSLGAEWQINSYIKPSLGVAYQMGRQKDSSNNANMYNPDMNAVAVGLGAVITPIRDLHITLGYMTPIFLPEKSGGFTFSKFVQVFGIGVGYRFL